MKIKEFLLQKVNKDTLKKESVQRAIKVTICSAFIFALIIQLVGCLFLPLSVYAVEDDSIIGTWVINETVERRSDTSVTYFDFRGYFYSVNGYPSTNIVRYDIGNFYVYPSNQAGAGGVAINSIQGVRPFVSNTGQYIGGSNSWTIGFLSESSSSFNYVTSNDLLYRTIVITEQPTDSYTVTYGISWLKANATKQDEPSSCPTLPELLRDYTGSFDSIVDMLNSTNYDQYEETIRFYEERAYNEGVSASFGENLLGATFNAPLTALNQWVLFETTGGLEITMGGVFSGLLALSILIILIKMFAGG